MKDPCNFDAGRAYQHTTTLCYPRRVGTRAERRAARYIWRHFTALGVRPLRERFPAATFAVEVGNFLAFACAALLVLLGAAQATTKPWASALCWISACFLVNLPWRVGGFLNHVWPSRTSSANLLGTLVQPPAPARVVFMAHYDTKSQLIPTGVRVGLVLSATLLCSLLSLLGLLAATGLWAGWQAGGPWQLSLVVAGLIGVLAVNVTGNRSPGAIDNGSAVGVLLELARSWRPLPGAPVEVVWVASGCEESKLQGAKHFLRLHESWWSEKPTLLINLESVGAGSRTFLSGEPGALRLAEEAAAELELPCSRIRLLGAGMDHEPFAARGLTALSILGDVLRSAFALHSPRDNMDLVELGALERAGRLATHLAWRWAQMHRPTHEANFASAPDVSATEPESAVVVARTSTSQGMAS